MDSRARFLACLEFMSDFKLGREEKDEDTKIVTRRYTKIETDEEIRFLLVGVVVAVIERENEERIIILKAPPSLCPLLWQIFVGQLKTLGQIIASESHDTNKLIIDKELWNQGTGDTHPGCVYIHISHQTHLAIINVADNFVADALKEVTEEVTEFTDKAAALEAGSLVVNFVTALRIDQPITEPSAATHIWKRIYKVRASHVVQLYHTPC